MENSTSIEIFEFKDGAEFVNSPLMSDLLFPFWLEFLTDKEKKKVSKKLAELIDTEDGSLSFRFSVKNTLFSGEKA
jgi:hypothetical protein